MKCAHCGKHGHTEDVCWHKHGKPEIANIGSKSAELLLHAVEDEKLIAATIGFNENTWIGDSGASCHMTNDDSGMFDMRTIDEEITSGSGKPMTATKIGSNRVKSIQCDGTMQFFMMTNVKYVPELCCKLFSLTAAIDKGLKIGNEGRVLTLRKGNFKIAFDKIIKKKTGFVTGIDLITRTEEINNIESHGEIIEKAMKMTNSETGREMAYIMFPNTCSERKLIKEIKNSQHEEQRDKWKNTEKKRVVHQRIGGIYQKFNTFKKHANWHHRKNKQGNIPQNRRIIKRNDKRKTRLITCGYKQLPRIKMQNFHEDQFATGRVSESVAN